MRQKIVVLMFFYLLFLSMVQAHELPEVAVALDRSEICAPCHPAIYKEWRGSFHALSSVHQYLAH